VVVTGHGDVQQLEEGEAQDLGESRQIVADLWTHTKGGPRGQSVDLHLPDGDSEAVAKMVTAKKIEIAAAGLHHATVKMKQIQERKKASDEEDESEITKVKIAQTKLARTLRNIHDGAEEVDKLRSKQADAAVKAAEAVSRVEMASKKKRKALKAKAKLLKALQKKTDMQLGKAVTSLHAAKYKLVGDKADVKAATEASDKVRIQNVALNVKLNAAKHAQLHARFMALKSKNMHKLANANFAKEMWQKKKKQGVNDVKGAAEMLKIMGSGPGKKEAAASLAKAQKRAKKAAEKYTAARTKVNKVKDAINKNEVKWAKKMAYKAVWKTAVVGAAANKADKAFTRALSDADKQAKKQLADSAHKEMVKVSKSAEKATANMEHVRFAAMQDKKARAARVKREKARDAKRAKILKRRKAEAKMAEKALSNTGKP